MPVEKERTTTVRSRRSLFTGIDRCGMKAKTRTDNGNRRKDPDHMHGCLLLLLLMGWGLWVLHLSWMSYNGGLVVGGEQRQRGCG